jgi:hypothetical protein
MRPLVPAVAILILVFTPAARAQSDTGTEHAQWSMAIGPTIGGLLLDPHLNDYRWDTSPTLQSGAQATVFHGRFGLGARASFARTSQQSGIPGETTAPDVNLTGLALAGQVRALTVRGIGLWGTAYGGRLHLGYHPDRLTFEPGGPTQPVTVAYDPVSAWDFGLGIEIRGDLTRQMALALQAERSSFSLDTAHRRGDEIVEARERFYSWGLRLQVSWCVDLK